ncbi:hypothetical protein TRAPUB_8184 [Trametes pubescens]|uniref:RGS domain-containing protein n=1 Tax=Trametes pubescens TaxID=154538 RepID=A0A1M2W672_TRAPU|nr:hypothetical protein TRAPUB_8184 [Trametes pubescens]
MSSRPLPPSASRSSPSAPKTTRLQPKSLLSLPHRLAHPPPPQPKAQSWGITPHFHIPLDEILDRKHLPPLGLKDFEEWLLFIDRAPENLYFILWLRDYSARYTIWARQSREQPHSRGPSIQARAYRTLSTPHPPPNPALALFYLRAKETFLTPDGPYALRLPQDVLSPFLSSSLGVGVGGPAGGSWPHAYASHHSDSLFGSPPPPPDPAVFAEVADRVRASLSESLDRFVVATFHNVGMPRAYCGCAGGTVIGLTGSAPILLANFLTGGSRWWRFTAIPGLWLGLTIVLSAMYGVCMMIYVFGDLRQLRSFELARFPDPEVTKAKPREAKEKLNIRMFSKYEQHPSRTEFPATSPQALTGPPPPLVQNAASRGGHTTAQSPSEAQQSRASRPSLHIVPPQPAHTRTPARTSYSAYPDHALMQSMSSASTSYSIRSGKRSARQPCFAPVSDQEYDTEDDCGASESDCDSDYSSSSLESDASTAASQSSVTDEGVSMRVDKAMQKRRRARRRKEREPQIHISDAFFDENPCPEGPATADPQERTGRTSIWGDSSEEDIGTGATFIHSYQWDDEGAPSQMCSHDVESQAQCAAEREPIRFDFDGLPPRSSRSVRSDSGAVSPSPMAPHHAASTPIAPSPAPGDSEKPSRVHFADSEPGRERTTARRSQGQQDAPPSLFRHFLGVIQQKCGPKNVAMQLLGSRSAAATSLNEKERMPEPRTPVSTGPLSPSSTLAPHSPIWPSPCNASPPSPTSTITTTINSTIVARPPTKATWQARVRRMLQVPAFASPLTPVLNPVVTRGQWEIVVRSAFIALVVSAVVIGALVAVPETRVVR